MNPSATAPTPAPLHDIVGPVWFWPFPIWITVLSGVGILGILIGLGWLAIKLLKSRTRPPTNKQKALSALEAMRSRISSADPYAFGVGVSDALRSYLTAEYGLRATTQTSLEFLELIRSRSVFSENEKHGLGVVLEKTDMLKFARVGANDAELLDLLDIAARLVRSEPQSSKPGGNV